MKLALAAVVALAAVQTYPVPFPREGTTKLLENDRVMVWRLDWEQNRPTAMHEHTRDLVAVVLDGGRVTSKTRDGAVAMRDLKAGDGLFQPRGMIHIEELVEPARARSISIELRNDAPATPARAANSSAPEAFPREGARLVVDNARVAIWDYQWLADRPVGLHVHSRDTVLVPVTAGEVRVDFETGETRVTHLVPGEVMYFSGAGAHREQAIAGSPRAILVELK